MGFVGRSLQQVGFYAGPDHPRTPVLDEVISKTIATAIGGTTAQTEGLTASKTMGPPQQPVAPAPAPVIVRQPMASPSPGIVTPEQNVAITPRRPADEGSLRRRAGAATGAAGVILPPVGVRGAGAIARTSILGR